MRIKGDNLRYTVLSCEIRNDITVNALVLKLPVKRGEQIDRATMAEEFRLVVTNHLAACAKTSTAGIGIWEWASNDQGGDPNVVMACRGDVIDRVPALGARAAYAKQAIRDKRIEHKQYVHKHGEDMPEVREWKWSPAMHVEKGA